MAKYVIVLRVLLRFVLILASISWHFPCDAALTGSTADRSEVHVLARWPSYIPDAERESSPQETRHTNASLSDCEGSFDERNVEGETAGGTDETQPTAKKLR
eukprot:3321603-Pyramimonas_sp.AAC.1